MKSKYMTLEKYAATLKVGDEVTIEYHSMAGDRQTIMQTLTTRTAALCLAL